MKQFYSLSITAFSGSMPKLGTLRPQNKGLEQRRNSHTRDAHPKRLKNVLTNLNVCLTVSFEICTMSNNAAGPSWAKTGLSVGGYNLARITFFLYIQTRHHSPNLWHQGSNRPLTMNEKLEIRGIISPKNIDCEFCLGNFPFRSQGSATVTIEILPLWFENDKDQNKQMFYSSSCSVPSLASFSDKIKRLCRPPFCPFDYSRDEHKCKFHCPYVRSNWATRVCSSLTPTAKVIRLCDLELVAPLMSRYHLHIILLVRDPSTGSEFNTRNHVLLT